MSDAGTTFQRKSAIEGRAVDRAAVLVDSREGLYFGVNRVGARIWSLLEQPRSVAELVETLTGEFTVDAAACRRETESFLGQLVTQGLVGATPRPNG
ncbi:MAG: hypothetical protein RLZZ15_436 [Verrucomicrobiota bacterium]|jgi:hypothetical protein